jgi:NADH:ubiquinone oxidoreductase subunit F (NADH-binding)
VTATARRTAAPSGSARLLAGVGLPPTLSSHLSTFGPLQHPQRLVEEVEAAGLRGRGGAGFPTASKLAVVAAAGDAVVVANGAEGEPASKKDRSLLRVAPHLVLDGAALAAYAVGARSVVVGVARDAPELVAAIGERTDRIEFDVRRVPEAFVAGEETALLRALEGKPAKPTLKPPYPFERGLRGRPTLVQNVETLAHVALIARFGARWFGRGTALLTLGGAVVRPGVHEIELGTTLADALRACGGTRGEVAAYLVGGYFGRWFEPAAAETLELTPDVLGAGTIVALPSSTCAVAECARVMRYLADESAGQCGPCVHGLAAIADAMDGGGRGDNRGEIARFAGLVAGRGACRHPDGAARFVESALEVFADEFARHVRRRGCGRRALGVLPVRTR